MKGIFRTFAVTVLLCCICLGSAVLFAGCAGSSGSAYGARVENSISYYYTAEDTSTRFICNDNLLESKLGGEADAFLTCDGTVGIARVGTGLYRIDKDDLVMVYPAGVDRALLSLDSKKIVFTTATEVHIYNSEADELIDVKPEGVTNVLSIVLSPDGRSVGYSVRSSDGNIYAYVYENGESRKLSNNAYIIGVADNAAWWYYLTPEADLYYANASKEKLIGSQTSNMVDFNRDLSEVLFDMNGVTYFSKQGKSAKRLAAGTSLFTTAGACSSSQGGSDCTAHVRDCGTLLNCVYYNYLAVSGDEGSRATYNLWFVNASCKSKELAKGAYQFSIERDGGHMTCLVDDGLYRMNIDDPGTAKLICSNVYSYIATEDAGRIYCVGYDRKLYIISKLGKPEAVLDDAVYCVLTDEGKCLCIADYDVTGKLYIVDGENPPKGAANNVYIVETKPGLCCYYSAPYKNESGNDVYDLYTSKDGSAFELCLKGVKLYNN